MSQTATQTDAPVVSFPTFQPHPLLRGAHRQTIGATYLTRPPKLVNTVRHAMELSDGDRLVIHDDQPQDWRPSDPVALLIHGVSGCHGSGYMIRTAAKLMAHRTRTFRLDMRGCGAGWKLAKHSMHAGRSDDIRSAILFLARLCPQAPLAAIGFSLGGAILLRALSQHREDLDLPLSGAMAIAPPIDLMTCSVAISKKENRLYDRAMARWLYRYVKRRRQENPAIAACDQGPRPRSIYDVDHRFTAPLGDFSSAEDYYLRCSAAPHLARIIAPTLILAAQDDPLIPFAMFAQAELSPSTTLFATERGGHVGFYGKRGVDPDRWWLDWRIVDWARQVTCSREATCN
jgi:predicted alpha/beta-fold hydrolase